MNLNSYEKYGKMLTKEERQKKLTWHHTEHVTQRIKQYGKKLFGTNNTKEIWPECCEAIRNPDKGVFIKDNRSKQSTHHCMFLSEHGHIVTIPCRITDEQIIVLTMEDITQNEKDPNWFIREYNNVARIRGMKQLNYIAPKNTDTFIYP